MTPIPTARLLPQALGVLTAAYSAALVLSPRILAKPCKLTKADGSIAPEVATVIRAVGARDVASGLLLAMAPYGPARRGAVAFRAAADLGDAAIFGSTLPGTATRLKVAGFAATWGLLCAYSGRYAG
ncbi:MULTISPECIES: hypothetical protein [Rhodococcus]|uniref:hypothetical protein n=1 Tax=Rhodococcus TaxID=1827 RepID=UPI000AF2D46E|nr:MULTISPECIES: hypothetical protein [Rhodococcus]RZL24871.1 MAG: hypothetical protein EOP31_11195 [Rhodococcus sp. (in: high G+C Gram-positive bacteria)]